MFSICFGLDGGYLALGGINHTFHQEEKIKYFDLIPSDFYQVKLESIEIENDVFMLKNEYFTIIDSGTTVSYFPSEIFRSVTERLKNVCNKKTNDKKCLGAIHYEGSDLCIDKRINATLEEFFDSFPTLKLKFSVDKIIKWKPKNYFYAIKDNAYCVGINEWG